MVVAWIAEVRLRDFESRLAAAYHLALEGYTSIVGRRAEVEAFVDAYPNGIVLVEKSLNNAEATIADRVSSKGGVVVVFDEEGGVYGAGASYEAVLRTRLPNDWVRGHERFWLWGAKQYNLISADDGWLANCPITVTGNPRFDLCKSAFHPFHKVLGVGAGLDSKPCVVVNTNFACCNNGMTFNQFIRYCEKMIRHNWSWDIEYCKDRFRKEQQDMSAFIGLVKELSNRFSDINVVVRPHPSECEVPYRDAFLGLKNVVIGSWIPNSRLLKDAVALIHHDCTTAIEGLIGGLRPISFAPHGYSEFAQEVPKLISHEANSAEEVVSLVGGLRRSMNERHDFNETNPGLELVRTIVENATVPSFAAIVGEIRDIAPEPIAPHTILKDSLGEVSRRSPAWKRKTWLIKTIAPRRFRKSVEYSQRKFAELADSDAEIYQRALRSLGADESCSVELKRVSGGLMLVCPRS